MPYLIVAVLSYLFAHWTIFRRRDAALVATLCFAASSLDFMDWVAEGWFKLYEYHPGLLRAPLADGSLGMFLSEYALVGSLCVLVAAYVPDWRGILAGTAIVTLLEALYVPRGLLEHRAWETWYTAAGFPFYFAVVLRFWRAARWPGLALGGTIRLIARFSTACLFSSLFALVYRSLRVTTFRLAILPTVAGNLSLARFLWHGLITIPIWVWVLSGPPSQRLVRAMVSVAVSIALHSLAVALGFQQFRPPWNPTWMALAETLFLIPAMLVDRRVTDWAEERPREPLR